ncbi:MAG: zf-HC2 domain-containing protein [Planctomycetota bacterium]|nr:zf-HC2 domain-containing protein [Planctomycetota bacterium]
MTGPLTCENVHDMLSAYNDGELSDEEMRAVGEHLSSCVACGAESTRIANLKRLMKYWEGIEPSPSFREKVVERTKREIEGRRIIRVSKAVLAVIAVILLAAGAFFLGRHLKQRAEAESAKDRPAATSPQPDRRPRSE